MSNRKQYKAMMNDVHAPAEVLGKVRGIPMEKIKKRTVALKFATATCAALLGVFVVTNGVSYAATGETWVEKATVYINGEPTEMDVHMAKNGDTVIGTMEYTVDEEEGGETYAFTTMSEGGSLDDASIEINNHVSDTYQAQAAGADCQVLESDDGRVILSPAGADSVDITDQVKDGGVATGTFQKDGATYVYKVTGESGNYHVSVEAESNPSAEL